MIDSKKIKRYKIFKGNIDAWARTPIEKRQLSSEEWLEIELLIDDLRLLDKKLLSKQLKEKLGLKIVSKLADLNSIYHLIKIAIDNKI